MRTLAILLLLASTAYATELPLIDTITYDVPDGVSCMAFDVQVSNGELLGVSVNKLVETNGNRVVVYSMGREDIDEITFQVRQDKNRFLLKLEDISASDGRGQSVPLWGFDEQRYKYGAIRGKKVRGDQW